MRIAASVLTMLLAGYSSCVASQLGGAAGVECVNGTHVVTVSGTYLLGFEGEYEYIVFERQSVGVCEPNELLLNSKVPFSPQGDLWDGAEYVATAVFTPPRNDVVYRYQPFGVRPDGSLQIIRHYCDSDLRGYGLVGCENAPFLRGIVAFSLSTDCGGTFCFRIIPCDENCWTEGAMVSVSMETFEQLSGEPAFDLVGQVVDVYGERSYCGMLGQESHFVNRIERSNAGACGPVPVREMNWGDIKATYR